MEQLTRKVARASLIESQTQTVSTTSASAPPAAEAPAQWLRRLWERMAANYGHAWTSTHGLSPQEASGELTIHGDTWAKALVGIDGQQLGRGIQACIVAGGEWPPAASRFRAMCLGIPSLARVRYELRQNEPSRFTRLVFQNLDLFRMAELAADRQDRMVRDAYDLAHEHVMAGGALPAEPVAALADQAYRPRAKWGLPDKPIDPSSPAAQASIAQAAQLLRTSPQWTAEQWTAEEIEAAVGSEPALTGKMAAAGPDA